MRKFYHLVVLSLLVFGFQTQTLNAQSCTCPNGNNANGPIISGAAMTPTVSCWEDLLALINAPGPMQVTAFDIVDGFVPVCIISPAPANNCVGSIMILVDAQDSEDNCAVNGPYSITVIIQDATPPVITCPANIAIECDESLDPMVNGNLGEATAIDICMADVTISLADVTISANDCETVIERTWSAQDCGNTATCVQTITVEDTQAPTFTVPADISIYVDNMCAYDADVALTGDVMDEMDNCDMMVDASFVDMMTPGICVGQTIITRTWTASDDCGNSNVQTQIITVLDETPPVISGCPSDVTVECDVIPSIGATMVSYVDNCDPTVIGITGTEEVINDPNNPFPCVEDILILRTWEAVDDCGNTASCTQHVTVVDTTDPIITCPGDATVNCEDDYTSASTGMASASDNCSLNVDIQESDAMTLNGCSNDFVIIRTWTATDECDNFVTCDQTITVVDNVPPSIIFCPADIVIQCDQDTSAVAQGIAEGDDLCSGMSGSYWANVITAGSCTHTYMITRTFTLTDECGNDTQCTQVISVEDTTPPDPTCPGDETVECDAIPVAVDPAVMDNCDMTVDISLGEVSDLTGCGNYTGTITRTWTFTDDCANTAECIQVITVEDNVAPDWAQAMPADVVVNCQSVPAVQAPITATDACPGAVNVDFVEDNQQGVDPTQCDYYTYIITRTWTATDECANETIYTQTINVQDVTGPNFTDPVDIVAASQLGCGDENDLSLTGFPTAITDNCALAEADGSAGYTNGATSWVTPNGYTISFSDIQDLPWAECSLSGNGLHHRKYRVLRSWTVEDPCGNATVLSQSITIIDDTPPTITCPADVVVECSDDLTSATQGVATATDDCDADLDITIAEVDNMIAGLCIGESIIERTWTATDICGNSSTCLQTITTEDTTPPVVTCPANTVAECSDDLTPTGQGMATATDNCDPSPMVSSSDAITAGPCDDTYTITRTWTVEDDCGNNTSCDQTIDVQDTTPPVFDQVLPADVMVNCQSVPTPPAGITATDACDSDPVVSFAEVSTQGADPTQCDYYTYTITRTWTAVDNCTNEEVYTQTITVEDVTAPAFTAPINLVAADQLSCGDEEDLSVTGFPTDIMDNCAPTEVDGSDGYTVGATSWTTTNGYLISFVDVEAQPFTECSLSGNGLHKRKYQIQRTWSIEDPCGNTTTALQTMTIIDDTPPVIVCPDPITIECDDELDPTINLALGLATATDNCDDDIEITITFADVSGPGSCPGESVITRTWTATDICGNSETCDQILTLEDTTDPTWDTAPADDSAECGAGDAAAFAAWLSNFAGAIASDNCSNATLSTNGLTSTPGCGNTIVYSVNVRATDECGLFIEENVSFTIEDTTPPVLTCAADQVVECTDPTDPANTGMSSATDNCGTTTVTSVDASTPGACTAEYVITRTWTALDECGLTSTCVQTITVDDSTPPVITCPANTAVECSDDKTSAANGLATATDNCDPDPMITESDNIVAGACDDAFTIERTWTATDECGNASSCIQQIVVDDTTVPVITCAANLIIECDESTDPADTGMSTATDNCDLDVALTYMDMSAPGGCPQEETITRTWTATDNCGNTATCDQTIEIEDTTPPVFTTPAMDETIECDLATNGANFTAWLASFAGAAATDNCGSVTLTTVGLVPTPGCGNTIVYSVTIRATDQCGNSTDDPATFTIEDTTAPDWDDPMPADANVECDAIPTVVTYTASDACDNTVDVTFAESTAPGACPQEQTITRTWTATDDCGNAITHVQTLTVEDSTPPTFDTPQIWTGNDGLECGDEEDLTITGFPTNIDDNCADDDVNGADGYTMGDMSWLTSTGYTISFSDVVIDPHPGGGCSLTGNGLYYRKYRVNRTWSVTDPCGNTTTSIQEINITDHTPPVVTCPADVTVECSDDLTSITQGVATATDNCDDALDILITEDDVITAGPCDGQYSIARTWTAEDVCEQTSDCVQTLTVEDTTPPAFVDFPMDETIECDLATNGANFAAWLSNFAGATATDNCSAVTFSTNGLTTTSGCGETVVYTVNIRIEDECGNATEESAMYTIIDTTVPSWDQAMPTDVVVECTSVPAVPAVNASDLCDDMVDVTFSPISTQGVNPALCDYYNYTITRTWVATDDCSNAITHTQVITVEDTTAPTFTTPASILAASQLSCGDEDDLSLTGFPTVISDNCAAAQANGSDGYTMGDLSWTTTNGYTISFVTVLTAPQPWAECSTSGNGLHNRKYHYTRTWTVEDPCGNSTTANQTITVIDDTPPVWDQAMPADETVECDNVPLALVGGVDLTATDNCDAPMDITYTDDELNTPGACTGEYILTRTWTAEDVCGNAITHTQTITVEDTTIPIVTCAIDVVIECDESDLPANTGMTTATDNCDPSPAITYADVVTPGLCANEESIARTWTITDDCNNSTSCLQTITVEDTTPPAITCPADVVVECSDDLTSATQGMATAIDNCDNAPVIAESDNIVAGACPNAWTIERTWTATDACNNSLTCLQTITVEDTTPPTFDVPVDIIGNDGYECGAEADLSLMGIPDNIDDNCAPDDEDGADGYTVGATTWMTSNGYTVSFSDAIEDPHPSGECSTTGNGLYFRKYRITRTWMITDPCGNTTTADQLINITDNTPPVWDQAMPADETVECDAIPVALVGGVDLTAMDNCDDPNEIIYTDDETTSPGACLYGYTITRTWTAEDVCGNAITHTQTITVEDTTPPTFTVPVDVTIQADASCDYDDDPSNTGDVMDEADNCSMGLDATYADATAPGLCVGETILSRTWTLTDDCGLELIQTQTITIQDMIAPVLVGCPADETISCLDPIPTPPVVTATDNCDPSPLVSVPSEVNLQTNDGSCTDHTYTLTRTWTATDGCNNSVTCSQVISVEDILIPVITLTGPATVDLCVGDSYTDMGATANDDCFGDITADIITDNPVDINIPDTYTVTYNVMDPCSNAAVEVTRTVIVHDYPRLETSINGVVVTTNNDGTDDVAPPMEICNTAGNVFFDVFTDLNNVPGDIRVFQTRTLTNVTTPMCDNCAAPIAAFTGVSGTATLVDPTMDGTLVMRFRAWLDLNSNNTVDPGECAGDWVEYTFILKADVIMTCANDTTVAACQDQATVDQAFTDWLTTTTFTGGKNPALMDDNSGAPDACGGFTTVIWTVTSDCEADVTCSATFTVTEDDIDPTFTIPADIDIYSDAGCTYDSDPLITGDVTDEMDNCGGVLDATYSDASVAGSCEGEVIITRTWSLTDLCGNTTSGDQTITVRDTISPTFTVPSDITINADVDCLYDADPSITGEVNDEADNCTTVLVATSMDDPQPGACAGQVIITRTWTLVDDCNNSLEQNQIITVIDNIQPVLVGCPSDVTIACNDPMPTPPVVTATDNCDMFPVVTGPVPVSGQTNDGSCTDHTYDVTLTWTATDACGNTATCAQVVSVQDLIIPVITLTGPATVDLCVGDSYTDMGATANDDCFGDITGDIVVANPVDVNTPGIYTVTYNVTDPCSNAAVEVTRTVTVHEYPLLETSINGVVVTTNNDGMDDVALPMEICNTAGNIVFDYFIDINGAPGDIRAFQTRTLTNVTTSMCDNCAAPIGAFSPYVGTATLVDPTMDGTMVMRFRAWLDFNSNNLVDPGECSGDWVEYTFILKADVILTCANDTTVAPCQDQAAVDQAFADWLATTTYTGGKNPMMSDDNTGAPNACGGFTIVTWTVTSDCEADVTCSATFTVTADTDDPTFTVPADVTIFTDAACAYDDDPSNTGDVIDEMDNCSMGLDATYTDAIVAGPCTGTFVITRTWTLTDLCNNSTSADQTITIQDNSKPSYTVPADITISTDAACTYDDDPSNTGDVSDEMDNCSVGLDATYSDASVAGPCTGSLVITRTWSLMDDCGNDSIQVQTITVVDDVFPTFTVPADLTIYTDASCGYDDDPTNTGDVSDEDDNCSAGLDALYSDNTVPGACTGEYIITRTWTLTDDCGNTTVQTQTIWVEDDTKPTFTVPVDITIAKDVDCNYDADVAITGDVTDESDNCSSGLEATWSDAIAAGSCEGEELITRTWTLTDDCGNDSIQTQTIIAYDVTKPYFPKPADVTIYTLDGATCPSPDDMGLTVNQGVPIASGNAPFAFDVHGVSQAGPTVYTDNCSSPANLDIYVWDIELDDNGNADGCERVIRVDYRVFDDCGNHQSRYQLFTIIDNTPPTFTVPVDITIYSDASCNYDDDPINTGDVIDEADNCSIGLDATYSDATVPGNCTGSWIITRTWTLEDDCTNSNVQTQTITVLDNTPPTFTVPVDFTIEKDVDCNYDADPLITGDVIDEADNCSTGLDATWSDAVAPGACEGEEIITRTWTLTDDCGNDSIQTQTIIAYDVTKPYFPKPADVTIYTLDGATCPSPADLGLVANQAIPIASGNAPFAFDVHGLSQDGPTVYTDNCSSPANLDIYIWDIELDFNANADECERVIRVRYRVYDDCGNHQTRFQLFTILDNTPPTFTVPMDITIDKDANCDYDADPVFTGDVTDEADNCTLAGLDATYSDAVNPGNCTGEEIITRTWTLVDNCANSTVQTQTIVVQDNTPPTFTVPADIEIQKDVNCDYDADPVFTGDVSDEADNCTLVGLDATYSDDVNPGTCEGEQIITRTWFLEDDCGNTTTQVQTITAVDMIVPTFPKPADVTITTELDGANCPTVADISLMVDQMNPITSGNAPFQFTVHGVVQQGPVIYSDNCSTAPNLDIYIWAINLDYNGNADECERVIRVLYRVYDDCGNYQPRQQFFTIIEDTPPTFTVPVDITIDKDANCNYDADPLITGDVTDENDNCSTGLDATYSDAVNPGNCTGEEIITRTWTLVDNCSNSTVQTQTIVVHDNTPPTFTVPADIEIQKDVNCDYDADPVFTGDVSDEADNCTLVGLDATYSDDVNPGTCEGEQIITRTWFLEDDCGNTTTQVQTITAVDMIVPIFPKPADQSITTEDGATCPGVADISLVVNQAVPVASGNAPFVFTVHGLPFDGPTVYSDNCSTAPNLDLYVWNINTSFQGVGDDCDRQIQVIFRVYDDCGNFQQRQQIFTILENTPPDLSACSVPLDGTVECTGDTGNEQSAINWDMANITYLYGCATDNCTAITVTSDYDFANYIYDCGLSGSITVEYTVTDECNNSTTTTATLTVVDNFGPDVTGCPNMDATFECDGAANNEVAAAAWDAANVIALDGCANEVCGDFTVSSNYNYANLVSTCGEAGVLTVIYTLEDECMNTTNFTAVFTIEDTTPPTIDFCPPAVAINCEDSQDPMDTGGPATASDVCDANPMITYTDNIVPGSCPDSYVIERTWIATDDCTNSFTCLQEITVIDIEKPVYNLGTPDVTLYTLEDNATCPGTPDISLDVNQATPIASGHVTVPFTVHGVTFQTPNGNGTDNCTPDDELKLYVWEINEDLFMDADECHRTIEVTFRLFDRCGNHRQRKQAYTIIENTPPVITCPANITINCDDDPLDLSLTLEATATDNCDTDPTITYGDVNDLNGCSMTGTITRTWMAEDNCLNTTECTQIITVQDVDPPVMMNCVQDDLNAEFECDGLAGNEVAAIAWNAANIATLETCAYDVCGVIVVTSNYNFATLSDQCGETGSLTATYTVTDECLNTSTITGTFTIVDNTAPDLTACNLTNLNDTHECDGDAGNLAAANTWNADNVAYLEGCVSDLCGTITVTHDYSFGNLTDECGITGDVLVTYTLMDECGNSTTATGTFTIEDTTNPSWDTSMPADITVECDAVPAAFVATASDGCDIDVDIVYTEVGSDSICLDTYILTRTWTATDDCNNAITHIQSIQVQDVTVPNPLCQDKEIFLDDDGMATITAQEVDNGSSDNCDAMVDLALSKTSFDCDDEGPNLVTLTVTDNCDNSNTCTATVTVTDAIAPTALCQDVTVSLDQFGQGSITPNDVDNGSYDNCDIASLVISQSQYNCTWLGTSMVTLTVTDIYSNVSTCTANVTVVDEIPPVAVCKNYFVDLNGQGEAPITYFDIDGGSTDNCSIVDYQVVPNVVTCADMPLKNVTLTVTDPGGNKHSCTATVVISDKLPPIMACKDLTFFLDDQGSPITIQPEDIDSGSSDNCEIESLSLNKTTFDCDDLGGNVVLLTAEDPSGNTNNCSATVTIIDAIPPVWTYMPGDITVNCIDVFDDNPKAADNCGGVNINWVDVQEVWPAGPINSYLVRRTWTAFDASGNEITYEQVVYVLPGGELLVNCTPNVTTQPSHFPIKVDWPIPSIDDICEGSEDMVQIGGPAPLSYFSPGTETLITYEHVDIYGTHYQCSFWVIVPTDASGYIVVLNDVDCEDLSLTNCEVKDLPNPDNYSFEYIVNNMTPIQFDVESNGNFEMFADGSAHLTGSWTDIPNSCGWDMDIWLHRRRTHDGWVAAGGNISSFSGLGDPKLWEFFEVDGSRSKMTGTGCYSGQNFNVRISPNFPNFGFQLGAGANTKTSAYGGWVIIAMTNNSDQVVAQGIFSFELDCDPTNVIKDAAEVISLDGFNYPVTWSTGTTGFELGDVSPGIFSVTVTDQSGSTDASTFSVGLPKDCILYYEDDCRPGNMTSTALVKQSSTFQGAIAERAIDQNTDGDFANGSVTSTLAGYQNYFSMALLDPTPIEKIRVWNRTDCCSDLLEPFYLFVSEFPIPDNIFPEDLVFEQDIQAFYHSGPIEDSYTFDIGQMGQYIKVQLAESGRLMLAEVQVLVCQEDEIGLQDDGFTAPEEEDVIKKVQVIDDVPTVNFWPNPANDYLEIDITQQHAEAIGVNIVNMQGVEVYRAKLPANHLQHLHLDTGDWGPGVYFMTISSANGARSLPLTIQH